MGVPVVIGAGGIERIVSIQLTADESAMLDKSAAAVRELIEASKRL
jgi:malate dehydrogenase